MFRCGISKYIPYYIAARCSWRGVAAFRIPANRVQNNLWKGFVASPFLRPSREYFSPILAVSNVNLASPTERTDAAWFVFSRDGRCPFSSSDGGTCTPGFRPTTKS